jgi:hypothetical protein
METDYHIDELTENPNACPDCRKCKHFVVCKHPENIKQFVSGFTTVPTITDQMFVDKLLELMAISCEFYGEK